jgi:NTE family protein
MKTLLAVLISITLASLSCASREIRTPPKAASVALVLGAGASRGFAHIGVLKVLESNRIPINMIVGTSAGSFVGSLYAYGFNAFQLQKMSFSLEKGDIIDLTVPDNGFVKGEKLQQFINKTVNNAPIERFRIPFYAVATDLQHGKETVFGRGNAGMAVRASCSIPGVFRPVRIDNRLYVDGGVVSPVAVDAARRLGADVVIAVDVSSDIDNVQPETTVGTILQAISIMYSKLSAIQLSRADVVIRPKVGYMASDDFSKKNEAVLEGEKAALEALPAIQDIVAGLKQQGRL